jgi:hypothetical protein
VSSKKRDLESDSSLFAKSAEANGWREPCFGHAKSGFPAPGKNASARQRPGALNLLVLF